MIPKHYKKEANLREVPKSAVETALFRQLKETNAKAVYISKNKNSNQRGTASVYFKTEADMWQVCKRSVYYSTQN